MQSSQIPIYVVSLERDAGRRELMNSHFAERNLEFEYLNATDASAEPIEVMTPYCRPNGPWGLLRPHDMACAASHLRAIEAFLETDADHALFCEDDIYISEDTAHWLKNLSWWPEDAGAVA